MTTATNTLIICPCCGELTDKVIAYDGDYICESCFEDRPEALENEGE